MAIKKNFKVVSNENTENFKEQEKITLTKEEKLKIKANVGLFFDSVKGLLKEGAVIIEDSKRLLETNTQNVKDTLTESFLKDPKLEKKPLTLHFFALSFLPEEKRDAIMNSIESIKFSTENDFKIDFKEGSNVEAEDILVVENIISDNLKLYSKELPAIIVEREKNLKLLFDARPDIKKYLEN